jgi:hypothetical protein
VTWFTESRFVDPGVFCGLQDGRKSNFSLVVQGEGKATGLTSAGNFLRFDGRIALKNKQF